MYLLQPTLFSFEELLKFEPETRLQKVLSVLDLSPALTVVKKAVVGPKGHCVGNMISALVAKQLEQIPTVAALVKRLSEDLRCGFSLSASVPSESTFSRLIKKLTVTDEKNGTPSVLKEIFDNLVKNARAMGLIGSECIAIDSSKIDAYEKSRPKKDLKGDKTANWGAKRDTHGNQITWFGYKAHIAVDCQSELPIALMVTPANTHDAKLAIPLIELVNQSLADARKPKYYAMDMGYDSKEIYSEVMTKFKGQALIPINPRGSKDHPEGCDFDGTPICSMGQRMVYWGSDTKTGTNKYRCPHVMGKYDCPHGSAWCSQSSYGLVVKTKVEDDPRMNCLPARGTRNWQKLYNKRTAVERCFGRLKQHLGANSLRTRGLEKVTLHITLSCIALLAGSIAVAKLKNIKQVA
ncbi:IS5/IS1182 family transposase [Desulforamulus aeronauticus]|uniref:Transposase, IS4 family n=1 Tax=Desulforamulus aeronauticus DSM 10349 TaxID=1121421 RepID=A0A1M6X4D9_9FIRM|nr:IS5/IS1182 family transposase [Desulforamulus aeronauticus]SHL00912.1 transposase, IS4 family [Desulforamulus aeronauticus DSM 10349]